MIDEVKRVLAKSNNSGVVQFDLVVVAAVVVVVLLLFMFDVLFDYELIFSSNSIEKQHPIANEF